MTLVPPTPTTAGHAAVQEKRLAVSVETKAGSLHTHPVTFPSLTVQLMKTIVSALRQMSRKLQLATQGPDRTGFKLRRVGTRRRDGRKRSGIAGRST